MTLSVTFQVNPLASIGANFLSFDAAYNFAVGAYGWYKARERTDSLIEMLNMKGANLVKSASFNERQYSTVITRNSVIRGLFIEQGRVLAASLPNASTALPSQPSVVCLRAVITALLCFYDCATTAKIVAETLPETLIQMKEETEKFAISGPILSQLLAQVNAVGKEEDNNLLRGYLLRKSAESQATLTGVPEVEIQATEPIHSNDMHLVMGLLKWMLVPIGERTTFHYATRSLRVWSTAAILQILGFEICPSPSVVGSHKDYEQFIQPPLSPTRWASVFLVTGQYGKTDFMQPPSFSRTGYNGLRPQIMSIQSIPWSAFRHLRGNAGGVDTRYLVDVWNHSFRQARLSVTGLKINSFGFLEVITTDYAEESKYSWHQDLLRIYSPGLAKICGRAMESFVPRSLISPGWNTDAITAWLSRLEKDEQPQLPAIVDVADNSLILSSIILGTIYGVVIKCCHDNEGDLNEFSEIVFRPDLLFEQDRLKGWANAVGRAVDERQVIRYQDWNGLVYEAILGADFGMFQRVSATPGRQFSTHAKVDSLATGECRLGGQANGLSAISRMVIQPTTKAEALCQFFIHRGQILSFPLSDQGFIIAAQWTEPSAELSLSSLLALSSEEECLHDDTEDTFTRADIEPCWDDDSRGVILMVRRKGITVASINLPRLISGMTTEKSVCFCPKPNGSLSSFSERDWKYVTVETLMDSPERRNASSISGGPWIAGQKVVIDARRGEAMALYAIGCCLSHDAIFTCCLQCASKEVNKDRKKRILILTAPPI